ERAREEPAFVDMRRRPEQQRPRDGRYLDDIHCYSPCSTATRDSLPDPNSAADSTSYCRSSVSAYFAFLARMIGTTVAALASSAPNWSISRATSRLWIGCRNSASHICSISTSLFVP